jgi:hypothetical protein
MAMLIDWSEVDLKIQAYCSQFQHDTRSMALTHIVLEHLFGLSPDEVDECITDGAQDRGIDAVVIPETDQAAMIHLFQAKCVDTFDKADNNFPSGEIDKLLSFIADLLRKEPGLEHTCNPLLWGKVQEIWDAFTHGAPKFTVHLVGNQAPLTLTEQARLETSLTPYRNFTVRHHSLESIARLILEAQQPRIDRKLQLVDDQYFERVDGNIRGLVATVQGIDLVRMITDPNDSSLPLLEIFQENARVYLTQKNKINKRIFESALSDSNAEFWYLNNGITITCDHFEYPPKTRAPMLEMSNIQIVNGGQTSNALFEAFQQDAEQCRNVLVLVRVYETKRTEISAKIAESTNSQTPIRSRDLRSNDEVQKKLEESFRNLGYYYERKSNQYRDQPRHLRIDALSAGQAYLAYQLHLPEVAGKDRGKIFGELYDEIFNDDIAAPRLLVPLAVSQPIEQMKKDLERAVRRGQAYDPAMLFLVDGAYHLLFAIAELCTLRKIDHWQAEKAVAQLKDATQVVQTAVKREVSDPAFAYKRFFKSTRARRYIEEAAREFVSLGGTT